MFFFLFFFFRWKTSPSPHCSLPAELEHLQDSLNLPARATVAEEIAIVDDQPAENDENEQAKTGDVEEKQEENQEQNENENENQEQNAEENNEEPEDEESDDEQQPELKKISMEELLKMSFLQVFTSEYYNLIQFIYK